MKYFVASVVAFIFGISSAAFSQSASLKENMKSADRVLKEIKLTANDPAHSLDNARALDSVLISFQAALEQTPEFIEGLPADQQPAAKQEYQSRIEEVMTVVRDLQRAFEVGDTGRAWDLLKKLGDLKNEGHDRFDP